MCLVDSFGIDLFITKKHVYSFLNVEEEDFGRQNWPTFKDTQF
jgi:hypothetical protein